MTPENLDWIDFTDHAIEKIDDLPNGIDKTLIFGRIKYGHGEFYKDGERADQSYNFYLPDYNVVACLTVQIDDSMRKIASVKTAFEPEKGRDRFEGDRFAKWVHPIDR